MFANGARFREGIYTTFFSAKNFLISLLSMNSLHYSAHSNVAVIIIIVAAGGSLSLSLFPFFHSNAKYYLLLSFSFHFRRDLCYKTVSDTIGKNQHNFEAPFGGTKTTTSGQSYESSIYK